MGVVVGTLMIVGAWWLCEFTTRNDHRPKVEPIDETWEKFYSGVWKVK